VATPAFGPEPEVLRLAGSSLIREVGGDSSSMPLVGSTLAELAAFAGTDLDSEFSAGPDTPALGPPDAPLQLDAGELDSLYGWFDLGWRVLDTVAWGDPSSSRPTVQLWPEHFDVGTALDFGSGAGVNLGFSPGDAFSEEPYVYVGPWAAARPGDAAYWNAPFGAFAERSRASRAAQCEDFIRWGLDLLSKG
jgi:hypothetical protein